MKAQLQTRETRSDPPSDRAVKTLAALRVLRFLVGVVVFYFGFFYLRLFFPAQYHYPPGAHGNNDLWLFVIYSLLHGGLCGALTRLCDPSRMSLIVSSVALMVLAGFQFGRDWPAIGIYLAGAYLAARLPLEKVLGLRKANKTKRTP